MTHIPNAANPVLDYQPYRPRTSRWVLLVFILSILAAITFFTIIPAIVTLIAALITRRWIVSRPDLAGYGHATAAVTLSGIAVALGFLSLVFMPSYGCTRCLSARSVCAANLRGIAQSMNVYAADNNDHYPLVPYAPYSASLNLAKGNPAAATSDLALNSLYSGHSAQAGSVQANLWILVNTGQVAPKQFLCTVYARFSPTSASATDSSGTYYDNFQAPNQLSYSALYPWKADGTPGTWWTNQTDAGLPLLADMTPLQGTGTPARNLIPGHLPADPHTWNSGNHNGDGQNVAYGDSHAEFARSPNIGPDNDNIYTTSANPSRGPAQFTGIPAGTRPPNLTADTPPLYDIIMLPVRNESTGAM